MCQPFPSFFEYHPEKRVRAAHVPPGRAPGFCGDWFRVTTEHVRFVQGGGAHPVVTGIAERGNVTAKSTTQKDRANRARRLFDDVIDSVQSEKPDENQVDRHSEIHDPGRNQQEHSGGQASDWQKRLGRIEVHPCLIADSEPSPRGTPVLAPALSSCDSISWINIAVVIARDQTGSLGIQGMRGLPGARFLTLPCRGSMDWHCPHAR